MPNTLADRDGAQQDVRRGLAMSVQAPGVLDR
jgi:hypothetical protein